MLLRFPESDVESRRSYKIKHETDQLVDSQVDFKNNKETVKKQIPNIDINFAEKKVDNERIEIKPSMVTKSQETWKIAKSMHGLPKYTAIYVTF